MSYTVAAVDKALTILECLADHPDIGVSELAGLTGSTKSQTFRLLYTLEQRGFVRKDEASRRYSLGYRTVYLGEATKRQTDLVRLAQPYLDDLAERSCENVHLVVREGTHSVCIALSESPQPLTLRLYAQVGRRGPLHAGGASKVLLAHAPADVREAVLKGALEAFTPSTLIDPERLEGLLDRIQKEEVYESENDLDEGAFSIAAPLRDHGGRVVAALSIAGPIVRLKEGVKRRHIQIVKEYSDKLSIVLGWRGGTTASSRGA